MAVIPKPPVMILAIKTRNNTYFTELNYMNDFPESHAGICSKYGTIDNVDRTKERHYPVGSVFFVCMRLLGCM